jgi:hypothetical protein
MNVIRAYWATNESNTEYACLEASYVEEETAKATALARLVIELYVRGIKKYVIKEY